MFGLRVLACNRTPFGHVAAEHLGGRRAEGGKGVARTGGEPQCGAPFSWVPTRREVRGTLYPVRVLRWGGILC